MVETTDKKYKCVHRGREIKLEWIKIALMDVYPSWLGKNI